jgi:NADPH2:quinone reductase
MKAIQCVEWGGPDKLVLAELPQPEPKAGEVRIRIAAAGVNFPDALIVQKKYQLQRRCFSGTEVGRSTAWARASIS